MWLVVLFSLTAFFFCLHVLSRWHQSNARRARSEALRGRRVWYRFLTGAALSLSCGATALVVHSGIVNNSVVLTHADDDQTRRILIRAPITFVPQVRLKTEPEFTNTPNSLRCFTFEPGDGPPLKSESVNFGVAAPFDFSNFGDRHLAGLVCRKSSWDKSFDPIFVDTTGAEVLSLNQQSLARVRVWLVVAGCITLFLSLGGLEWRARKAYP